MNIKRNIIFSPESRKKDNKPIIENVPIRMRVIYGGKRVDLSTGYRIDISKWDNDKQRVKNGCTNKLKQSASEINADLLKYYADIQDIFKGFEVIDIIPTPDQLREAFSKRYRKETPLEAEAPTISLMDIFDEFVKECGVQNNWTDSTYEKFAAVKAHLISFDPNLTFELLNESKLTEYVNYFRDTKKLRNSTIGKQMGFLK
jgi:hypothetical protein